MQVGSQQRFDPFCLPFWSAEPKTDVICIANVGEPAIGGIVWISSGVVLHQAFGRLCLALLPPFSFSFGLCLQSCIDRIVPSHCCPRVAWAQRRFDVVIELIQVDLSEQR